MKKPTTKLTFDEIEKLLETTDKDHFNHINWQYFTEKEIDSLLESPNN